MLFLMHSIFQARQSFEEEELSGSGVLKLVCQGREVRTGEPLVGSPRSNVGALKIRMGFGAIIYP